MPNGMFGRWMLALVLTVSIAACAGGGTEGGPADLNASVTVVPNSLPNGIPGTRYATTLFVKSAKDL